MQTNPDIAKITQLEHHKPRTVQQRIYYAALRELFARHTELRLDHTFEKRLARYSEEEMGEICQDKTLDIFLMDHPDAKVLTRSDGERLIPMATMKRFMVWALQHGQIPEEKRSRVETLMRTENDDDTIDLMAFYVGLDNL